MDTHGQLTIHFNGPVTTVLGSDSGADRVLHVFTERVVFGQPLFQSPFRRMHLDGYQRTVIRDQERLRKETRLHKVAETKVCKSPTTQKDHHQCISEACTYPIREGRQSEFHGVSDH